jgi:DNA-directed RNA polymerase subunit omega
MIEALKSEEIVERAGGRFKLCALVQRRLVELMDGARPLVERGSRTDLEIVLAEILERKLTLEIPDALALEAAPPPEAPAAAE